MSFADLILRRPLWEKLSQEMQMSLREGAAAVHLYDAVAELMHGEGARFPEEQQKQVEDTADRMKSLIQGAGARSPVLGAFVSVLIPGSLALEGQRDGVSLAVVPDHLSPSVHKDSRLLVAAFQAKPLKFDLEISPEGYLFQAARQFTNAQDIQTGHAELDQKAVITGSDEAAIKKLLTGTALVDALLGLFQLDGKWLITSRGALITVPAGSLKGEGAAHVQDALVRVVVALRSAQDGA